MRGDVHPLEGDVHPLEGDVQPLEGDVQPVEGVRQPERVRRGSPPRRGNVTPAAAALRRRAGCGK